MKRFLQSDDAEFIVARGIALSDSIGEGYGYCSEFTRYMFDNSKSEWVAEYREVARKILNELIELYDKGGAEC